MVDTLLGLVFKKSVTGYVMLHLPKVRNTLQKTQLRQWENENRQRSIMALSTLSTGGKQNTEATQEDQNDEQEITRQVLPIVMSLAKSGDPASRMRCSSALRSLSMTRTNLQLLLEAGALEVCFEISRMERMDSSQQITPSEFNVGCDLQCSFQSQHEMLLLN